MQAQAKFCLCFSKFNTKLFLCCTNIALKSSVGLHLTLKDYSCDYQYEMMNYYEHQKLKDS